MNTIQLKRGADGPVSAYTGPEGEITYNQDTQNVHLHDGVEVGGHALLLAGGDAPQITSTPGTFTSLPVIEKTAYAGETPYFRDEWVLSYSINFDTVIETITVTDGSPYIDAVVITALIDLNVPVYVRVRTLTGHQVWTDWSDVYTFTLEPIRLLNGDVVVVPGGATSAEITITSGDGVGGSWVNGNLYATASLFEDNYASLPSPPRGWSLDNAATGQTLMDEINRDIADWEADVARGGTHGWWAAGRPWYYSTSEDNIYKSDSHYGGGSWWRVKPGMSLSISITYHNYKTVHAKGYSFDLNKTLKQLANEAFTGRGGSFGIRAFGANIEWWNSSSAAPGVGGVLTNTATGAVVLAVSGGSAGTTPRAETSGKTVTQTVPVTPGDTLQFGGQNYADVTFS